MRKILVSFFEWIGVIAIFISFLIDGYSLEEIKTVSEKLMHVIEKEIAKING